ncbi:MAG: indole-3-glycerol phosphate synthase TrpC [Phycisphaerales bacterium]|nr:indole-3-glycerol phosphate synthase TrpC [Phycisphaerales bacterium]
MATILDNIVETKRREVEQARTSCPLDQMKAAARHAPPSRDFFAALAGPAARGVHLIAEIKKKSPSAGLIRADFDPVTLAGIYADSGASALSVLTDESYFDGRLEYIEQVKRVIDLPVLRKDFMIDPYQIYEARAAGADAILLIGEVLDPPLLREMRDLAGELGMTSLIEVHEEQTLDKVLKTVSFNPDTRCLLGINNRNLKIQRIDLDTTRRLADLAPPATILVSESGIKTRADVEQLVTCGARALLIGETFMRAPDIRGKIDELLGSP